MKLPEKIKIFNDPIYGFITIPNQLIFDLIAHPYFQRLRRISQMGLSYLVYPGAHHTRFQHAIGSMYLMQKAINVLRAKDIVISLDEEKGLLIAILLHDIGHGPFSHAMEHNLVEGVSHEKISLLFMERLNEEFDGELSLAIEIFKGTYRRHFMYQLISGQLDMDRVDYLKRDSFYTGVPEGSINAERIITMLNVVNDYLVVEEKGIYSIEKFLVARRLMYWQVYLHKTSLAAEQVLIRIIKRVKELVQQGDKLFANTALSFFLETKLNIDQFPDKILQVFAAIDDIDVLSAIKEWSNHKDPVLSALCKMILNRDLPKVKLKKKSINPEKFNHRINLFMKQEKLTEKEAKYFIFHGKIKNRAYNIDEQNIHILLQSGKIIDVAKASDQLNLKALSKPVTKYYICYPKK